VNNSYYQYSAVFEEPGVEFFARRNEAVGDLFKVHGAFGPAAMYDRGDGSLLVDHCGYKAEDRYRQTYGRKTWDWKQTNEVKLMFEGIHAANKAGPAALRDYLSANFDYDGMMSYVAVRNWSTAWDDVLHNYYLYKRPADPVMKKKGGWMFVPWDFDAEFGSVPDEQLASGHGYTAKTTFYIGEEGNNENRAGPHFLKSFFIKTFRAEFNKRLVELSKTVLAPANVQKLVDEWMAGFDMESFMATPGRGVSMKITTPSYACDPLRAGARVKKFATDRHAVLVQRLGQ
jgi:hypothetical protein